MFLFFTVITFSVLIMLSKNRIRLVTEVEYISICLSDLNTSGYLALFFDSDIKGVHWEW